MSGVFAYGSSAPRSNKLFFTCGVGCPCNQMNKFVDYRMLCTRMPHNNINANVYDEINQILVH